jgi:hypothetical protein
MARTRSKSVVRAAKRESNRVDQATQESQNTTRTTQTLFRILLHVSDKEATTNRPTVVTASTL